MVTLFSRPPTSALGQIHTIQPTCLLLHRYICQFDEDKTAPRYPELVRQVGPIHHLLSHCVWGEVYSMYILYRDILGLFASSQLNMSFIKFWGFFLFIIVTVDLTFHIKMNALLAREEPI